MKKIMKRLLTGVLTLATVFTALPVTQVHAADSVYTTTDGKAGTIVKIDNGGSEVSSFEESIMNADGQIAYCIDINTLTSISPSPAVFTVLIDCLLY